MSNPNPGDTVLYTPSMPLANMHWVGGKPLPAIVLSVQENSSGYENMDGTPSPPPIESTTLALRVLDRDGVLHEIPNALLLTDGATPPATGNYATVVA